MTDAQMRPVISDVFPFAHAHDAFAAMRNGTHFGKIVIDVAGA
jgi:NADPH:quinone reductase-like Zn-dependent oxidoreductase